MGYPVILGLVWGMAAAVAQHLHLRRSAISALRNDAVDPSKRISRTLMGSLFRLLVLTALFLVAWKSSWIRLDVSLVAFALFHLILMFKLGFNLRAKLSPPGGSDKTSG